MILADKIIALRKKNGWSQEELAEKVNVTRQSVSKWEGAQSVPDLEKILQLANIFGVSTDYLLKDEVEETEYVATVESETNVRRVSMEEANEFLRVKEITSTRIAFATVLCILSPICLIMLGMASEIGIWNISENFAGCIGMVVLLLMVVPAVVIYITSGSMTSSFEYLEKEVFETEYGVTGMVKERQKQYKDTYTRSNVIGVCLCMFAVIPVLACAFINEESMFAAGMIALLFLLIACGVFFFINAGIQWESMQKLLQEGDYTKRKKERRSTGSIIAPIYWPIVVAIYFVLLFVVEEYQYSWVIWPVAGVLYAALVSAVDVLRKKE
uniref:helix-turn-helix domain-containing protein n=1 Tax=Acetatifactor sp. TaxID=1872090 RepID=UPI0040571F85